jgi:cobalamin biosynthesis protein CobT
MNDRVFVLRQSIVKLTQMLAGKGVQVTQQGVSAYVRSDPDGRPVQVNLPYLPDNATEQLINALQGFLDHEVAHILFTDFKVMPTIGDASVANMLNIVEDCRIEREMAKRFEGSAHNLSQTRRFFLDKYITPKLEAAIAGGDTDTAIGVLTVPLVRALAGQDEMKDFIDGHSGIVQPLYDKLKDLAGKIENCADTAEALALAREVVKRLRGSDDDDEEESGKPAKGSGRGGRAGGKGKGRRPAAPPKDDDEDGDLKTKAAAPDDDDAPPPPPEDDADDKDKDDDADKDDDGEDGDEDEDTGAGAEEMTVGMDPATWKAIDKETANDFDASVSAEITDVSAAAAADADYLVYSTDKDVIEPLHIGSGYKPEMLTNLQDKVDHMVGPMQKDLERAISARSLATWSSGLRSGRLHPANLSRLAIHTPAGYDDRVFRKKHESSSKDVAAMLVVDISGSMHGSKVHTAVQAAYALASTLERIGIPSMCVCFTTGPMVASYTELEEEAEKISAARKGKKAHSVRYSRMESLYMPILKGFNERMGTEVKKRFGWMPNSSAMNSNVDGESVMIAGRMLLARRESGKVMIVLSDGYPAAHGDPAALKGHLKRVVKDLMHTGVSVVGIGIQSEAVQEFYPKNMVLNNVEELPAAVMKTLRGLIVQGAK